MVTKHAPDMYRATVAQAAAEVKGSASAPQTRSRRDSASVETLRSCRVLVVVGVSTKGDARFAARWVIGGVSKKEKGKGQFGYKSKDKGKNGSKRVKGKAKAAFGLKACAAVAARSAARRSVAERSRQNRAPTIASRVSCPPRETPV